MNTIGRSWMAVMINFIYLEVAEELLNVTTVIMLFATIIVIAKGGDND